MFTKDAKNRRINTKIDIMQVQSMEQLSPKSQVCTLKSVYSTGIFMSRPKNVQGIAEFSGHSVLSFFRQYNYIFQYFLWSITTEMV